MAMTRPPRARLKILDAAEHIVKTSGAAKLTFDELAHESGVTRGGITYHFPTKELLLQALVARDVEHWSARQACHMEQCRGQPGAEVLAHLRTSTDPDPERQRFVGGMLGAVAHDPSLLEPVRSFLREHQPIDPQMSASELRLWILRLAADGLFWMEVTKCTELPAGMRERLLEELEHLARDWGAIAEAEANSTDQPV